MKGRDKLSLLIVDDQDEVLEVYHDVLKRELGHQVDCATMPAEALRHVRSTLFDVVIVDAKNSYKGAPLGGLILADEISAILGKGSVLLMSQYDVREEVRHFNPELTFLPKPKSSANLLSWARKELLGKIQGMVERQYAFVAMPFSDDTANEWYRRRLAPWMEDAGFTIKRMDEIQTTRPLNSEMLKRIHDAHFVVFCALGENPNVYFEIGYAVSREKFVVAVSPERTELPFDVRASNVIVIGRDGDEGEHRSRLFEFMAGLRGMTHRSARSGTPGC